MKVVAHLEIALPVSILLCVSLGPVLAVNASWLERYEKF